MPVIKRDYYEILGVSPAASQQEIKKAFYRLALQHHPDRNPHDSISEEKFKEIAEAYGILNNPQKRTTYDRCAASAPESSDEFCRNGKSDSYWARPSNDLIRDIFRDILGYPIRNRQKLHKGEDLRYHLSISFEEAALGKQVEIDVPYYLLCTACQGQKMKPASQFKQCPRCRGKGRAKAKRGKRSLDAVCRKCSGKGKIIRQPCLQCKGKGKMKQVQPLTFNIPAGVRTGTRLRVPNRGNPDSSGGPSGDLYIVISVNPHPFLEREGDDTVFHLAISFSQASLGDQVAVPTLNGMAQMDIPPGTQPGDVLRLKHRGIPCAQGAGRGDQQVIIGVRIPSRLTSRQRNLLKQFAQII